MFFCVKKYKFCTCTNLCVKYTDLAIYISRYGGSKHTPPSINFGKRQKDVSFGVLVSGQFPDGHFPDGHIPDGLFPDKHIPDGHFPDQTLSRRALPRRTFSRLDTFLTDISRTGTSSTDISPTRHIPDGHFPKQINFFYSLFDCNIFPNCNFYLHS